MDFKYDDIKRMLPNPNEEQTTDDYYLTLANYLGKLWHQTGLLPELDDEIRKRVVLDAVAYFQDVVADAGIWRSFVKMCRHLYNRPVPFYDEPDDYCDAELNLIDIQFVIWYSLESRLGFQGLVSPLDTHILRLASQFFKLFDFLYDDAPEAEDFKGLHELDLSSPEQVRDIFATAGWLFWNSYLMRPVSKHAYEPEISDDDELSLEETLTDENRLHITFQQPTGPLALLADDWLRLIIDDHLPKSPKPVAVSPHKYYRALCRATKGEPIAFCATYEDLEKFLSEKMNWGNNPKGHLPQLAQDSNFVLFADRRKGLCIAKNVAHCFRHPANPCYDAAKATADAHRLIMEPSFCPPDIFKYAFSHNLVPDAIFPVGNHPSLLQDNWDFIARLYLNRYYFGD